MDGKHRSPTFVSLVGLAVGYCFGVCLYPCITDAGTGSGSGAFFLPAVGATVFKPAAFLGDALDLIQQHAARWALQAPVIQGIDPEMLKCNANPDASGCLDGFESRGGSCTQVKFSGFEFHPALNDPVFRKQPLLELQGRSTFLSEDSVWLAFWCTSRSGWNLALAEKEAMIRAGLCPAHAFALEGLLLKDATNWVERVEESKGGVTTMQDHEANVTVSVRPPDVGVHASPSAAWVPGESVACR